MGMRGPKRTNKVGRVYGDYRVIDAFKDPNNTSNRHYYVLCECVGCGDLRKVREDNLKVLGRCKMCKNMIF